MSRPAICFVATSPFTVNAFLRDHIMALTDQFDVTVMTALEDNLASLDLPCDVSVVGLDIVRAPSPWRDLKTLCSIWRHLAGAPYQAVMSITPKAGLLAMLAAFVARVPHRSHCFTGQVWATKQGVKRRMLKACDQLIVALSTQVFADGRAQAEYLVAEGVVDAARISVLGPGPVCGVDVQRFHVNPEWRHEIRQLHDLPDDAVVGLFLGRLHRDKGVLDLVAAFESLMKEGKCSKLFLLVVGPVDDVSVLVGLDGMSTTAQMRLRRVGGVRDPERYFAAADFLILPSYREGFGMVVLEAAAAGLPAIVTDIYGLRDAVIENTSALVVPAHNPGQLAVAMHTLTIDHALRQRMGAAAAQRVQQCFSVSHVTAAWCAMFQDLLLASVDKSSR